jgi:hypothetical protein
LKELFSMRNADDETIAQSMIPNGSMALNCVVVAELGIIRIAALVRWLRRYTKSPDTARLDPA